MSEGPYESLGSVTQRGGKVVIAFACEGDFDVERLVSNTFELEWPPRSGRKATFPRSTAPPISTSKRLGSRSTPRRPRS